MAGNLKVQQVQLGDSATASNNFVLSVPATPDGTVKLSRGVIGSTTEDVLSIDAAGLPTFTGRQMTIGTSVTASGTAVDFTGIPSWIKRITVMFNGVSTNGTGKTILRVGDGAIVSSGYSGSYGNLQHLGTTVIAAETTGFELYNNTAAYVMYGAITLFNTSGTTWVASGLVMSTGMNALLPTGGSITLTGTLDRVRITAVNGTDTFDAGTINIMYEG